MSAGTWRIALASAIGTSHITAGLPCQDSSAASVMETADGTVLAAIVSDGAGSAACADRGSSLAVSTMLDLIGRYFEGGGRLTDLERAIACRWLEQTVATLERVAQENSHAVRDYACTLLVALVGESSAAFMQVGDGAIVVSDGPDEGWSWVFWPQHGEFANTTNFIVSPDATEVLEFDVARARIDEIAVFSDGIEHLVLHYASQTVHAPFFDAMFPAVRKGRVGRDEALCASLDKYLMSQAICERTDDDKTLILASRRTEREANEAGSVGAAQD